MSGKMECPRILERGPTGEGKVLDRSQPVGGLFDLPRKKGRECARELDLATNLARVRHASRRRGYLLREFEESVSLKRDFVDLARLRVDFILHVLRCSVLARGGNEMGP